MLAMAACYAGCTRVPVKRHLGVFDAQNVEQGRAVKKYVHQSKHAVVAERRTNANAWRQTDAKVAAVHANYWERQP
jgi:hypothetical protein